MLSLPLRLRPGGYSRFARQRLSDAIKGTYKVIQEPKYGEYSKLEDLVQNYLVNLDEDDINKRELKL